MLRYSALMFENFDLRTKNPAYMKCQILCKELLKTGPTLLLVMHAKGNTTSAVVNGLMSFKS